ncbi:hypothetical protein FHT79_002927 [Rhizobium sp. BK212]|jgi:hypothetical protein|nr:MULTISPECIES: hypothetical protein [Rhizobium]MBB4179720.1 hypothetical protein [Rhizobium sp. BK109]MBB4215758.1 hypothetical protein [Rhizobium sp. BK212]
MDDKWPALQLVPLRQEGLENSGDSDAFRGMAGFCIHWQRFEI